MTIEELDKQLEIDRKLFLTQESTLLDEGLNVKDFKKGFKSTKKGISKAINKAGDVGSVVKDKAFKDINFTKKLAMKNIKKLKEKDNKYLLNGDTSEIKFIAKALVKFSALSALAGPFIGALGFLVSNNLKKTSDNNKRYKLYREFEADKAMVDEKIDNLREKKQSKDLTEDQEKQLYALVKLSKQYESDMRQLKANIIHNDSVLNARKKGYSNGHIDRHAHNIDDY